jgi:hypothetical protein
MSATVSVVVAVTVAPAWSFTVTPKEKVPGTDVLGVMDWLVAPFVHANV